ncbi:MAG: CBS domain-containing protein, partial [Gemmatimonadetes bacterium]|nr:CBS domain-containing protein [Gemmatimonadota bacterium]
VSALPVIDRFGRAVGVLSTRDVLQAAREMLYFNVQRLFVEERGALVGVISQTDIVDAVAGARIWRPKSARRARRTAPGPARGRRCCRLRDPARRCRDGGRSPAGPSAPPGSPPGSPALDRPGAPAASAWRPGAARPRP